MIKPYEEHREEFRKLQVELDELNMMLHNNDITGEEYQIRYDSITERRVAWYEEDKNY